MCDRLVDHFGEFCLCFCKGDDTTRMAINAMYLSVTNRPLLSSPATVKSLQVRSFTLRCSTGSVSAGAAVPGSFSNLMN